MCVCSSHHQFPNKWEVKRKKWQNFAASGINDAGEQKRAFPRHCCVRLIVDCWLCVFAFASRAIGKDAKPAAAHGGNAFVQSVEHVHIVCMHVQPAWFDSLYSALEGLAIIAARQTMQTNKSKYCDHETRTQWGHWFFSATAGCRRRCSNSSSSSHSTTSTVQCTKNTCRYYYRTIFQLIIKIIWFGLCFKNTCIGLFWIFSFHLVFVLILEHLFFVSAMCAPCGALYIMDNRSSKQNNNKYVCNKYKTANATTMMTMTMALTAMMMATTTTTATNESNIYLAEKWSFNRRIVCERVRLTA